MKLFALSVLYKSPDGKVNQLKAAHELSSFGYFQRGSIKEFMDFTSKIIVERTAQCSRASVKEQEYICHVSVRSDNLAGVVIADHEYPQRVAHTLINRVLDEFSSKISQQQWPVIKESEVNFTTLPDHLQKYQDPKQSDAMTRIQSDLDETKIILYNTMEQVLERGEKLDDLVEKSEGLSMQSKTFYKTAKKTNSCCVIL
ncbi:hypothetical protein LOTGIDRAFT_206537 [Lottia gigantea]|uniref:V-SNARE coiled-coil homology domain-containing protein n=1 Tax=Lottia gigantea TaxID=225164 RepID=V4AI53_LOTGI|nr:hypothetical protein LOTGIDRAFT_206537 [Lottia gigantea]ESO93101.1 hypothetical protein LOTGIDRAFT_206537 [Lottia gigantea]